MTHNPILLVAEAAGSSSRRDATSGIIKMVRKTTIKAKASSAEMRHWLVFLIILTTISNKPINELCNTYITQTICLLNLGLYLTHSPQLSNILFVTNNNHSNNNPNNDNNQNNSNTNCTNNGNHLNNAYSNCYIDLNTHHYHC